MTTDRKRHTVMTRIMMALTACIISVAAWAVDINSAKNDGLVGEQLNGYLGLVNTTDVDAAALVTEINRKRKAHYQSIANKQNTALANIEQIAGEKLVQRAKSSGQHYQTNSGWEH